MPSPSPLLRSETISIALRTLLTILFLYTINVLISRKAVNFCLTERYGAPKLNHSPYIEAEFLYRKNFKGV